MTAVDILLKHGRVIDPDNYMDGMFDVALKDGKVFKVGKDLDVQAAKVFDATGCLVTPGLIDPHVHCYEYATPLGINPDAACLSRGVTTIVDAGSSGASTFLGLRKYVVEKSRTRVKCLLHIALHGLAAAGLAVGGPGECDSLKVLDEDACEKCILENRDVIVGVKVRLTANVCAEGRTEAQSYRRALSVARRCGVPLMTHHSLSSIPTQKTLNDPLGCPADLDPGDIYTHAYHAYTSTILDTNTGHVHNDVIAAKSRGVLFDVGHGAGGFNWKVAEMATQQGFWPDLLGSDLHTLTVNGPGYDLPTIMTKFLHLGMSLTDIIKSVTSTPARAYKLNDVIGSLSPGKEADITVLKIEDCDVMLEDTQGQCRHVTKRFVPVSVWKAGVQATITHPSPWPDPKSKKASINNWDDVIIKDAEKPKP